jgi:sugar (pentulose or hexulose) kinase
MPERRRDSAATIIASQVVFGNHGTKVSSSTGSATTNSIVRRTSLDETSIETFMASFRTGYSKRAASMLGSAMGFVADSVNRGAA